MLEPCAAGSINNQMVTRVNRFLGALCLACCAASAQGQPDFRIGIAGTDSSHCVAFAKLLNDPANPQHVPGGRIVAAWKGGSPDVEASESRVDGFAAEMSRTFGVKFYDSIEDLARNVDALMILSGDGRPHLDEARRAFPFHKPVFIDKPLGGTLRDGIDIYRLARRLDVPCFSGSSERFSAEMAGLRQAKIGRLMGVFVYGPATLEPHHPDFFWYGIHAVEKCYTVMGTGCETVVRTHTGDTDVITGVWADGRVATVRGNRYMKHEFSTIEFGTDAIVEARPAEGYGGMLTQIIKFYRTGISPVSHAETIEILTFMEAADESRRRGGAPVSLAEVLKANGGADGI